MNYLHVHAFGSTVEHAIRGLVDLANAMHMHRTNTVSEHPNEEIRRAEVNVSDLKGGLAYRFAISDYYGAETTINGVLVRVSHETDAEKLIDLYNEAVIDLNRQSGPRYTPCVGPCA